MDIAKVGNVVEFHEGLRGRVEKVNENSVIVDRQLWITSKNLNSLKKLSLIINAIRLSMTKWTTKPSLFLISFVLFHILLFLMRNEDQVFWHMMTGIFY